MASTVRTFKGKLHTQDFLRSIGVADLPPRTSPFDPGYDPATLESHLDQSAALVSILKISMACWLIADKRRGGRSQQRGKGAFPRLPAVAPSRLRWHKTNSPRTWISALTSASPVSNAEKDLQLSTAVPHTSFGWRRKGASKFSSSSAKNTRGNSAIAWWTLSLRKATTGSTQALCNWLSKPERVHAGWVCLTTMGILMAPSQTGLPGASV